MGSPASGGFGDQVRDAARTVEEQLKKTLAYINDNVVPEVRRSSSTGLREAARTLENLANELDKHRKG